MYYVRASRIKNLDTRYFVHLVTCFAYTIVHLTFPAPQIVIRARVYANVYLAMHLLQLAINPEPSLAIQTVFYIYRTCYAYKTCFLFAIYNIRFSDILFN